MHRGRNDRVVIAPEGGFGGLRRARGDFQQSNLVFNACLTRPTMVCHENLNDPVTFSSDKTTEETFSASSTIVSQSFDMTFTPY